MTAKKENIFVGFGLGAIQSGLFLAEAFKNGHFDRLVVAEVDAKRVAALRRHHGTLQINVAEANGRIVQTVTGVEVYNPMAAADVEPLVHALADACEWATALPSIDFYDRGKPSVAQLLREALARKRADPAKPPAICYTAENHNHAAERLAQLCDAAEPSRAERLHMVNTVIGKMSSVVTDPAQVAELGLAPVVPDGGEAFLVEAFNRILISQLPATGFQRLITVFEEKPDLLPFEEAKLYGHNAVHALLGFLAAERGLSVMSDLAAHPDLVEQGRRAFMTESGAALIAKHQGVDPLFTDEGFADYAEDLLTRMLNPFLRDPVSRIIRDPLRKLGWHDRLIGTIRLVQDQGLQPTTFLQGVRRAMRAGGADCSRGALDRQWAAEGAPPAERQAILELLDGIPESNAD